jgi:hypothetical protein
VEALKEQLGTTYKKNSLAHYLDQLVARELEEAQNPNLAQKRVLEGTLLEDLACPRKRAPGKKLDGNVPSPPMSPRTLLPSLSHCWQQGIVFTGVVWWRLCEREW